MIKVFHKNLARYSEQSPYKSKCPCCEDGVLLVYRDQNTLVLQENDCCISCGEHFVYLDIEELRKREGM